MRARRNSIGFLFVIASVGIVALGHHCRADGSPLPPAPPPPPPRAPVVVAPGAGTHATSVDGSSAGLGNGTSVLLAAGADSIFIEDIVEEHGIVVRGEMESPRSKDRLVLATGDTLVLNGDTPAGVYDLANGSRVTLGPPGGYPRGFMITPRPHPVLAFSVSSRRRIGVLVASEQIDAFREQSDMTLADLFRAKAQYRSSKVRDEEPLAFALPLDWYRRAWIELPDSLRNYRMLFFGYGESGNAPRTEPILRYGTVRFDMPPHAARKAVALPGTEERLDLLGEIRLVCLEPTTVRVVKVR